MLPFRGRVDSGAMAIKGYSAFPKLQNQWNLTIRTLVGGLSYPSEEVLSVYSIALADRAINYWYYIRFQDIQSFFFSFLFFKWRTYFWLSIYMRVSVCIHIVDYSRGWPGGSLFNSYYPRCRVGCYSIPWIAPFYPWFLPYNAEC